MVAVIGKGRPSGIRAILAVPMVREDRLIGCLAVTRNHQGEFPSGTIELLRTFATQSALAIQNARLFREIEEKSRQLEAASQHKSEFLANMSHELRTPLNAIIGFSEVLTDRMFGDLNEKQEEYLKDIYASGTHLLSLINDILDLSKIEAGRMEMELTDFDLPQAIDNALTLVRERAGRRGIALHQSVEEHLGAIKETGEEGVRLAQERHPSLVLMDIRLPGIDGIEALRQRRAEQTTRGIPSMAMTASVMTSDRQRITDAGFDAFQSKPLKVKDFVAAVERLLDHPGK